MVLAGDGPTRRKKIGYLLMAGCPIASILFIPLAALITASNGAAFVGFVYCMLLAGFWIGVATLVWPFKPAAPAHMPMERPPPENDYPNPVPPPRVSRG